MAITGAAFGSAAKKIKAFNYAAEAEKAYADFPWIKNKVIFIDVTKDKIVYPANAPEKIRDKHESFPPMRTEIGDMATKGMSRNAWWDNEDETYILFSTERKDFFLLPRKAPLRIEMTFSFDHELAHSLFTHEDDLRLHDTFKETVADVFAAIRHFQRYGDDADKSLMDGVVARRAADLIFKKSSLGHFTAPVLEKFLAQADSRDWSKLTPAETIAFATDFSVTNWPGNESLEKADKMFKKFHGNWAAMREGDASAVEAFAKTLANKRPREYKKWGDKAIDYLVTNYSGKGRWPTFENLHIAKPSK